MAAYTQVTTAVTGDTITAAVWNNEFSAIADALNGISNAQIAADAAIALSKLATGALPTGITVAAENISDDTKVSSITFVIGDGLSTVSTGVAGYLEIPFACTINRYTIIADASGSIQVDIWKDTYANAPPTNADSITASAPVSLSSTQKNQDSTLTGWTTSISGGDILGFNVDSATTVKQVTISLKVTKT